MNSKKIVCVLLSTYNGEKFLREQLESVFSQEDVTVKLSVRDDGSSDSTLDILKEYEKEGKLTLTIGENIGWAKSFSWLIKNAPKADSHTVLRGESLWLIAKKYYGDGSKWRQIYEANKNTISDPNRIREGMNIIIP